MFLAIKQPKKNIFFSLLPASTATELGSIPAFTADLFSRLNHISDLKTGTPVSMLPGTWHHIVNARTGWPCDSIWCMDEIESLIGNFYFSMAAHTLVSADLSLTYRGFPTRMMYLKQDI